MAMITLHNASLPEVTILSNTFIDNYMPEANGEFVKVYIYLLRALSSAPVSFSLEQMADRLLCTERDILRALKYWAKQQLLTLDFTDNNKLCGISLLTPVAPSCPTDAVQDEISVTSEQPKDQPVVRTEALTPDRVNELKQNEDIIQLLYVAEQYLGKTLSPTVTRASATSRRWLLPGLRRGLPLWKKPSSPAPDIIKTIFLFSRLSESPTAIP